MARDVDNRGFRTNPGDEEGRKFDQYAHAVTTIDEEHRLTHDGMVFHASGRDATVANAESLDILINVPALTFPHFRKAVIHLGDAPADMFLYEGVTTSVDGTAAPTFNRNRNSTTTPDVVLTTAPTVSGLGTLIHDRFVGDTGGLGSNQVASDNYAAGEEWVLAPSTKYLIRATNNSGGSIVIAYEVMWYEIDYES